MYIFKNPRIGGEVGAHKDSSFLITDPLSVCGVWISLDSATKENGCMWGVPGSHVKGPNQFMRLRENDKGEMETYMDPPTEAAEKYDEAGAVPLEVSPGSIVLLHGSFLHYSKPNTSDKQRHAYTLHIVEKNYKYSEDNWIRRQKDELCEGNTFRTLEY
jgi:phytanoyl-CoA hydroxylase